MTVGCDALVAGAGLWGCVVARRLAEAGRRVQVIERRPAVGGNCRCETDAETGIEVHLYGSHIFHTHDRRVWDFIRRFTEFNGYQHKVLAHYRGKTYSLPLGLALINKFFGVELKPGEVAAFMSDETHRSAVFDAFFRGYTSKQWGLPPESVDPTVIRRVPVRNNYDTNYFNDYWQGIPSDGYNRLFERLLDHANISVRVSSSLKLDPETCRFSVVDEENKTSTPLSHADSKFPLYYSGPIDALFDYEFGALPWRSLRFERETLPMSDYQGTSVVNFTEASVPQTRIHEFKHYHPERQDLMALPKTVVMREYPLDWEPGRESYYPIRTAASEALLAAYRQKAADYPNLVLGGRLGEYRYYDMDQVVASALQVAL